MFVHIAHELGRGLPAPATYLYGIYKFLYGIYKFQRKGRDRRSLEAEETIRLTAQVFLPGQDFQLGQPEQLASRSASAFTMPPDNGRGSFVKR